MKALVIGGTGPTGPYVIEGLLKRGYEVSILHRGTHEVELPREVEHIHGDPHFVETLEQALGKRTFDLAVAMYGRLRFVAQVMRGRVPRFISVGAGTHYKGVVGFEPSVVVPLPIPEGAPLQTDPKVDMFTYRIFEAERTVMEAHQAGHYSATHFRYPGIYGPRQLAPQEWCIIRRILDARKRLILLDGGLAIHGRGYAENMAHALLLAVDKPYEAAGQIYNVRDEFFLSVRGWVNTICSVMNYQFEFVEMPYSLASPARIYSGRSQHRITDISKVQRELGYRDVVPQQKAIELTVKWYLENRPEAGGKVEQQFRDLFDYAVEDRLMDGFLEASVQVKKLAPPRFGFRHPYAHPERPGEES